MDKRISRSKTHSASPSPPSLIDTKKTAHTHRSNSNDNNVHDYGEDEEKILNDSNGNKNSSENYLTKWSTNQMLSDYFFLLCSSQLKIILCFSFMLAPTPHPHTMSFLFFYVIHSFIEYINSFSSTERA